MASTADLTIERLLTQLTEAQAQNSDILTKLSVTRNEATKLKIGPPTEFTGSWKKHAASFSNANPTSPPTLEPRMIKKSNVPYPI